MAYYSEGMQSESQSLASAAEGSVSEKPHKTLFCAVSRRSASRVVKHHLPGTLTGASAPRFPLGQPWPDM